MKTLPHRPELPREIILDFIAEFSPRIVAEARKFKTNNQLGPILTVGKKFRGTVFDRPQQNVQFWFSRNCGVVTLQTECTCNALQNCQHVIAVLQKFSDSSGQYPIQILESDSEKTCAQTLQATLQRDLTTAEKSLGDEIDQLFRVLQEGRTLNGWQITEAFGDIVESLKIPSYLEVPKIWAKKPVNSFELLCFLSLWIKESSALPAWLNALSIPAAILKDYSMCARARIERTWYARIESQLPEFRFRVLQGIDFEIHLSIKEPTIFWKHRMSPRLTPMRKQDLRLLFSRGGGCQPEAEPVKKYLACGNGHSYYEFESLYKDDAVAQLGACFSDPIARTRFRLGDATVLPETPLKLAWRVSAISNGDQCHYHFKLCLPTRADATEDVADQELQGCYLIVPHGPGACLYFTEKSMYLGPTFPVGVFSLDKPNMVPEAVLRNPTGIRFLEKFQLPIPEQLKARLVRPAIHATIRCTFDKSPKTNSSSYITATISGTVNGPNGQRTLQLKQAGWVELPPTSAQRSKHEKHSSSSIEVLSFDPVEPLPTLLQDLGLRTGDEDSGFSVRWSKQTPEIFADWCRRVPPEIELELDATLQGLRDGTIVTSAKVVATPCERDWFDIQVILDVETTLLTPDEIRLLLNAHGKFVELPGKGWRRLILDLGDSDKISLAKLGLAPEDLCGEKKRAHVLQLSHPSAERLLEQTTLHAIRKRANELLVQVAPEVPTGIALELRNYQREGFNFLAYLTANKFGGILADDMGLGKTIQTLAWLVWLKEQDSRAWNGALIVCPKSVVDVWAKECHKAAPDLTIQVLSAAQMTEFSAPRADITLINYATLRHEILRLQGHHWTAAILDEAQYIKTPASQVSQASIALIAEYRLALTGTPIENRLLDLWSIMRFCMPGFLGKQRDFVVAYDKSEDPLARERLAARVRPFLLRRTKEQVVTDLPEKVEEDIICELEGEQSALYRAELKRAQQMLLRAKTQRELEKLRFHFFSSLLRLRQICCDPRIIGGDGAQAEGADSTKQQFSGVAAKLEALVDIVEPIMDRGERVLIFSQFVSMLKIIRTDFEKRGWKYFYLDGSSEDRGALTEAFTDYEQGAAFLISLKAGAFGMNLMKANYVVLFDPWWNPAVEQQAIDRVHRIGQTKTVFAYRLVAKNTIEQKIRTLQADKARTADQVLGEERFTKSLNRADFEYLFSEVSEDGVQSKLAMGE